MHTPKKGDRHKDIVFEEFIAAGGQGEVHRVDVSGRPMALKLFYPQYSEASDEDRLRWLISQKLWALSTLLAASPQRIERIHGRLAHLSEFVPRPSLEDEVEHALASAALPWSFPQGLQIAAAIAQGIALCEDRGIAAGDIAGSNLTLTRKKGHLEVHLLDIDNYAAPGQHPPRMLGQQLYLAPEIISGAADPSPESDRYALGVLLHEILLLVHPKAGRDASPDEFIRAVEEGRWDQDPAFPRSRRAPDGYPAEVLSTAFHRLFRQAQSTDPAARPTAKAWVSALWDVLDESRGPGMFQCDACAQIFISDTSKDRCPYCGSRPPVLGLEVGGRVIPFQGTSQCVGRSDLAGSKCVSKRHLVIRRVGPELLVEDISSSGTWRRKNGTWTRLPARVPIPIGPGDSLRIGDTKARVVVVK